jgi:hypothetical protein
VRLSIARNVLLCNPWDKLSAQDTGPRLLDPDQNLSHKFLWSVCSVSSIASGLAVIRPKLRWFAIALAKLRAYFEAPGIIVDRQTGTASAVASN